MKLQSEKKAKKENEKYKKIVEGFSSPTTKLELLTIIESALIFQPVLLKLQDKKVLIHKLHYFLNEVVMTIAKQICKQHGLNLPLSHLFNAENIEDWMSIGLSFEISDEMDELNLTQENITIFVQSYIAHYKAIGIHLVGEIATFVPIMKCFECLDPLKFRDHLSVEHVKRLYQLFPIKDCSLEDMVQQFEKLQYEDVDLSECDMSRIDKFWSQVFEKMKVKGNFENLKFLFTNLLCVSHGQAEIERHFSVVGQYLTIRKTRMTERTYNAVLNVMDALSQYDNKPELVPISEDMITAAKNARKNHAIHVQSLKQNNASTSSTNNDNNVSITVSFQ